MKKILLVLCLITPLILGSGIFDSVRAQTVPDELIYEGQLFDSTNNPITAQHTIRISVWNSNDFIAGDVTGAGAINTGAATYGGWTEIQDFTPAFNGSFSIELGSVVPMPVVDFDTQRFFQIEIKPFGAADTAYELLDPTGDNGVDTDDRQQIGSVLYAKNSDRLEERVIGTAEGDIPVLATGGQFIIAQIPGGTNEDVFILDNNDDAPGNIVLQFGNALGKTLFWNAIASLFEFNDSVKIDGDLEVTGNVITPDQDITTVLSPRYANAVIEADGSNNVGTMRETKEIIASEEKNLLTWTSRQSTIQDYDVQVRYALPEDFRSFQNPAFRFSLQTTGTVANSRVDFRVEQEGNAANQVLGTTGNNLVQNSFATRQFSLNPATVWTAGDIVLIKIKVYSRDQNLVKIGDIEINTVE